MTALEVVGAAGIWAVLIASGIFLGLVAFAFLTCLLDRWRIHRAFWSFKSWKWLSEEELNDYLNDHAQEWWKEVKEQKSWCRSQDYVAGMRAAAKHLIRDHVSIVKPRARMVREIARLRSELAAANAQLETPRYASIPGTNMIIRRCENCGRVEEVPTQLSQVRLAACSKCTAELILTRRKS